MILVDVNLLLFASGEHYAQHRKAREWLDERLNGHERVGLPWATLLGFVRLVTNPRVINQPPTTEEAWLQVEAWLSADPVWIPEPTERHREILGSLLLLPGIRGNLVPDAHLAALAIEHGLTLCTDDSDFARFPNLHRHNPLLG